ncbi:MAG: hypothetical protein VYC17_01550 [Nitrospinota bacterium]|nr:hypothetical protein [Nitrospinota bacterium]
MDDKKPKEEKTKLADRKGQRHALPFDRKKGSGKILLQRVRQKHSFEETKNSVDKNNKLAQIWDEDLCE